MKNVLHSPWTTVTIASFAIIAGYIVYLHSNGGIMAATASQTCPVEACKGDHCDKTPGCEHGLCMDGCSGNCPH